MRDEFATRMEVSRQEFQRIKENLELEQKRALGKAAVEYGLRIQDAARSAEETHTAEAARWRGEKEILSSRVGELEELCAALRSHSTEAEMNVQRLKSDLEKAHQDLKRHIHSAITATTEVQRQLEERDLYTRAQEELSQRNASLLLEITRLQKQSEGFQAGQSELQHELQDRAETVRAAIQRAEALESEAMHAAQRHQESLQELRRAHSEEVKSLQGAYDSDLQAAVDSGVQEQRAQMETAYQRVLAEREEAHAAEIQRTLEAKGEMMEGGYLSLLQQQVASLLDMVQSQSQVKSSNSLPQIEGT